MAPFRLLVDVPLDGPTNMAVDDVLLESVEAGAPPVLRLYRWAEPTLSLGYFQRFDDPARQAAPLAELPVVRRVTGGGAILHAAELTYSIAVPIDHPLAGRRPETLYQWMHDRITEAVAKVGGQTRPKGGDSPLTGRAGPFLCFNCHAPFDLMAGEALKLAGSAQRRTRAGVLQHGSVVLDRTHPAQPSGSIGELVGRPVSFEEFADAVRNAVTAAGVALDSPGPHAIDNGRLAFHRAKHAGDDWLRRR